MNFYASIRMLLVKLCGFECVIVKLMASCVVVFFFLPHREHYDCVPWFHFDPLSCALILYPFTIWDWYHSWRLILRRFRHPFNDWVDSVIKLRFWETSDVWWCNNSGQAVFVHKITKQSMHQKCLESDLITVQHLQHYSNERFTPLL